MENKFRLWPLPEGDNPYGPTPKQKLLDILELSDTDDFVTLQTGEIINLRRPHYHPLDIVLFNGGGRSGKTLASVAAVIKFLLDNPGSTALIGAENYKLLQRTALQIWEDRFTHLTPWDHLQLKNKLILKKPTAHDQRVIFANGSMARFMHFNDSEYKKIRGIEADIIHFEEASLLKTRLPYDELVVRLSGKKGPIRQLILTTNPDEIDGWINDVFKVYQSDPMFKGEKEPIVDPCKCHLCPECLKQDVKVEFIGGEKKSVVCHDGERLTYFGGAICPRCKFKKANNCPGNQVYSRVIEISSSDNPHNPSDFVESSSGLLDETTKAKLVDGKTSSYRVGMVYKNFSQENVIFQEIEPDYSKDIIWALDFNKNPQCSVICQEDLDENGKTIINVIGEIVMWDAVPDDISLEFVRRYKDLVGTGNKVLIYGDPAALNSGNTSSITSYHIIEEILSTAGFEKELMVVKTKGNIKINVIPRVDCTNAMLLDQDGDRRIFFNRRACKHLIKSLNELPWHENGNNIDKRCDRAAVKNKNKSSTLLMSHPTDALGYYIYRRFPIIKNEKSKPFIQVVGDSVYELNKGELTRVDPKDRRTKYLEDKIERSKKFQDALNKQNNSLKGIIDRYRRSSFMNYF